MSVLLSEILPPFQLIPALLRTIIQPEALFIAGLIFIILVTFIFGRVYCSFLCPLGTIQDLLIWGSKRIGLKSKQSFSKPHNGLRYTILALVVAAAVIGFLSPASLLDPYSLTGRIFTYFLQPLIIQIYNLGILTLKPFDIYLYPRQTAFIPLSAWVVTAVFVLLILYFCAQHGRLYCNTLCPAGALLGLISRISFFQFTLNKTACSECSQCETVCKAQCIDVQNAAIDMSRCVGCFNCLQSCSRSTINYQRRQSHKSAKYLVPGTAWLCGRRDYRGSRSPGVKREYRQDPGHPRSTGGSTGHPAGFPQHNTFYTSLHSLLPVCQRLSHAGTDTDFNGFRNRGFDAA